MPTRRGWWFFVAVLTIMAAAVCAGLPALALTAGAMLVWFFVALIGFHVRLRLVMPNLHVMRRLQDVRGPVQSLWAGRSFTVLVRVYSDALLPSAWLRVTDRIPFQAEHEEGDVHADGVVWRDRTLLLSWRLRCGSAGTLRFEGVRVQCADVQGFFYHHWFLRAPVEVRVLPPLADGKGRQPAKKRLNILPLTGPNRFMRPGSGSELLDLRDYAPGDPPKTIAWKVSARRDRLITKEYESEVPLRCMIFADVSSSVRVGPVGDNALARIVEIASALTQATAAFRDLPGVCLFDDDRVRTLIRPARGQRHVVQVMGELADAAALTPTSPETAVEAVLPLVYSFANDVYPELTAKKVNHCPWWLPWWAPRSPATIRALPSKTIAGRWLRAFGARLRQQIAVRLSSVERQRYRWRKKSAAILAARYGLGPGGIARLLEADEEFVVLAQRFLAEHHIPYHPPLIGPRGEYLHAAPGKIKVLAQSLMRSVARGKDNEMYVLIVDLLELENHMDALFRAVRSARGRHHEVLAICPWPPGVALPKMEPEESLPTVDFRRSRNADDLLQLLEDATTHALHSAYHRLRRAMGRIGVPLICAAQEDASTIVLDRLERMRHPVRGLR